MKKLKRIFAVFFCLLLASGILGGCGKAASSSAPAPSASQSGSKPLKIVTTIFPEYDWVREILGDKADHAEVTMLLDNGVDLHSYQPTADDIIKISDCDLFIYVGGESDGWVEDALKETANKDMQVINLLDVLGEQVAGCSAETEASFETISFLAGKVDELGLPCVLTIEGAQHKIAETIVQNSAAKNQSILTLDSMQSTISADAANGTTYLSVMESNLDVLKQALN